jgi:hypothetical protein
MLHVFSINQVKLMTRTPTTTDIKGSMEFVGSISSERDLYTLLDDTKQTQENHYSLRL